MTEQNDKKRLLNTLNDLKKKNWELFYNSITQEQWDNITKAIKTINTGVSLKMRDRDIAIGYQNIKNHSQDVVFEYIHAYEMLRTQNLPSLGKVLCVNDNFAINSVVKQVLDCSQYDTIVAHGAHQKYCFHICQDSLFVDSFYTEIPDTDEYDTILVDSANISEEEYVKLLSIVNDSQNLITVYDGIILLSTPEDSNHIPIAKADMGKIRGERTTNNIINEYGEQDLEDYLADEGVEENESYEAEKVGSADGVIKTEVEFLGVDPAKGEDIQTDDILRGLDIQPEEEDKSE